MVQEQMDILEVFVLFYEELYSASGSAVPMGLEIYDIEVAEVRSQLKHILKNMKSGKSCAEDGLVVEMLKRCGERILDVIAALFAEIISWRGDPPDHWKASRLLLLFKKGNKKYFLRKL